MRRAWARPVYTSATRLEPRLEASRTSPWAVRTGPLRSPGPTSRTSPEAVRTGQPATGHALVKDSRRASSGCRVATATRTSRVDSRRNRGAVPTERQHDRPPIGDVGTAL